MKLNPKSNTQNTFPRSTRRTPRTAAAQQPDRSRRIAGATDEIRSLQREINGVLDSIADTGFVKAAIQAERDLSDRLNRVNEQFRSATLRKGRAALGAPGKLFYNAYAELMRVAQHTDAMATLLASLEQVAYQANAQILLRNLKPLMQEFAALRGAVDMARDNFVMVSTSTVIGANKRFIPVS